MNYKLIISVLIGLGGFWVQCSSGKKAVKYTPIETNQGGVKPKWVTNRPTDPNYYIGIAVASKVTTPTTYATVAQGNALNELASSIEVRVKSNSMLFSFEEQNAYRDEFKEFVQVKANQNIENYELVATWENDIEYWVYYRLSKAQFEKDKNARISKAIDLSVSVLNQAELEFSEGNYRMAMIHYFDALKPVKPYLGESLNATLNGAKDVYLGNYLFTQISQATRAFTISSKSSKVKGTWGSSIRNEELTFWVKDPKGQPISQVPVNFTYSEGIIRPRDGVSSTTGSVYTEIKKLGNTNTLQEVKAELDFEAMVLGNNRPDEIDKIIFERISNVSSKINIEVVPPKIFVQVNEGNSVGRKELREGFMEAANAQGFLQSESKNNADITVKIEFSTRNAGESYGLKNVLLNVSFSMVELESGKVVYQDQLANLKGVGNSVSDATNQAYQKAIEQMEKKVVPRFYRKYIH